MIDKNLINEEYSFTTTDENGNEVICDTMAMLEKDNVPIIIYTDYSMNAENKFNLYVSKVVSNEGNFYLEKIDNYENLPEIRNAIESIWNEK